MTDAPLSVDQGGLAPDQAEDIALRACLRAGATADAVSQVNVRMLGLWPTDPPAGASGSCRDPFAVPVLPDLEQDGEAEDQREHEVNSTTEVVHCEPHVSR
jgi:hypothetical protein